MLTHISCRPYHPTSLSGSNLAHVPDRPSMLDVFEAACSTDRSEARFVAAQEQDARSEFQKDNMTRMKKKLASLERNITGQP